MRLRRSPNVVNRRCYSKPNDFRVCSGFWTPAITRRSAGSARRRPKSADARSRGKYGTRQCSECYGDRMLVAISMVDAARAECFTTFAFWHERCTRVFLMFLARVISNGCGCQKQHIPQPIARLIGRSVFGGMVRINFLRVEISTAYSSKLGLRYSSRQLCHCVMAGSM